MDATTSSTQTQTVFNFPGLPGRFAADKPHILTTREVTPEVIAAVVQAGAKGDKSQREIAAILNLSPARVSRILREPVKYFTKSSKRMERELKAVKTSKRKPTTITMTSRIHSIPNLLKILEVTPVAEVVKKYSQKDSPSSVQRIIYKFLERHHQVPFNKTQELRCPQRKCAKTKSTSVMTQLLSKLEDLGTRIEIIDRMVGNLVRANSPQETNE